MTYGKAIYMITYLVSLKRIEISYLFDINIIKAKMHLDLFLSKYICRQLSISVLYAFRLSTDSWPLVGKNFFQPKRFSKAQRQEKSKRKISPNYSFFLNTHIVLISFLGTNIFKLFSFIKIIVYIKSVHCLPLIRYGYSHFNIRRGDLIKHKLVLFLSLLIENSHDNWELDNQHFVRRLQFLWIQNQFGKFSSKKIYGKNTSVEKKWIIWRDFTFAFLKF